MANKKEVSLKIEHLPSEKNIELRIYSEIEMQFLLQDMQKKKTRAALYYDGEKKFILTKLLVVNNEGLWLDIGPYAEENEHILQCDSLTFVGLHQQVKVQFEAHGIETALFNNEEAFYLPVPEYLLRIQRREYFRLSIPAKSPIMCNIPINPEKRGEPAVMREVSILDISCGGIALLCEESETEFQRGKTYKDCQISLPNFGTVTVAIEVRNCADFTITSGLVKKRISCQFIRPNYQTTVLLQNYINRQQFESLVSI